MSTKKSKYLVTFILKDREFNRVCTRTYWSTWKFAFKKWIKGECMFFTIKNLKK